MMTPRYLVCRKYFKSFITSGEEIGWNHVDWERIVFSGDSRFQLCPYDHRRRVWRRSGQRADPAFTIARHTGPQPGIMVWGATSFNSRALLVVIRGIYSTAVRQRHSENCFATVPFEVPWAYFSA
ncbi:transposable element Tc1 transposase [Trichonephila clavipes]|nr:transposable element Tc1 transposase [Trichonephila clavipes]